LSAGVFETELEAFRVDFENAARFHYESVTIQLLASENDSLLERINQHPLYWKVLLAALSEAMFISLGRVFDRDARTHNVHRLLKVARENTDVFSKDALRQRKMDGSSNAGEWIGAYEPSPADWRRLRKHVAKWEAVYQRSYAKIRDKVFAHRERMTGTELNVLLRDTSYGELEKLISFLDALHEALWQLYMNGRKPVIRQRRRSARAMLANHEDARHGSTAGERAAKDTRDFLDVLMSCEREESA
jgi:hypothetical protein